MLREDHLAQMLVLKVLVNYRMNTTVLDYKMESSADYCEYIRDDATRILIVSKLKGKAFS